MRKMFTARSSRHREKIVRHCREVRIRQEFERRTEARSLEPGDEEALRALRRGWCLGSEEFRQKMLALMEGKLGENHAGELRRETAEQKASRIIGEELARRGWQESDLAARPRSDPGKLAIAARLRKETTLPVKWIAARVKIGTTKGAKSVLHRLAHGPSPKRSESCAQLEFQSTVTPFSAVYPVPFAYPCRTP